MFHPSPPILNLQGSLDGSFTLGYVTAPSSAPIFTTTTASSADPLPITSTSLQCLGARCRSYSGHGTDGPSPGKIDSCVIAHPPPLPGRVTKRISGFGSGRYLTLPSQACQRFAPSLSGNFGYGFLQIRHWLSHERLFPHRAAHGSFFRHPCLRLHVTSFQVRDWTFTS